jgi:plasmid stabilization system protein ParE
VSLAIEHATELCALSPYAGTKTDEPNVYRHPLSKYRYTIFYRVDAARDIVEIAHVTHGARVRDLGRMPEGE